MTRTIPARRWQALLPALGLLLICNGGPSFAATQSPIALPGDHPLGSIPENSDLRQRDLETFISASPAVAQKLARGRFENPWGTWQRQSIRSGPSLYLVYSARRDGSWPLYSQGSWVAKKDSTSGAILQIKLFLKSDPGTFIRVYPDSGRVYLDLVIYGGVLREGVPLPFDWKTCLTIKTSAIIEATRATVDWALLEPDPAQYADVSILAGKIRAGLTSLRYADDGGLDEEGRPVYIATGLPQPAKTAGLNCSGFAQWVVDGLIRPETGAFVGAAELSQRLEETRKSSVVERFEEALDPYFGLDWTRNLAFAARAALESPRQQSILESDLRQSPFSLVAPSRSAVNGGREYLEFPDYAQDAGFPTEGLAALLWWQAIHDPGYFYLASLSEQDKRGLRHHYHVAVLLPWFDSGGAFTVDVFESAAETSLITLSARTAGQMVHLVRVKASRDFEAPGLRGAGD
jgi:hypothetical protein